jgi:hypothetical protein
MQQEVREVRDFVESKILLLLNALKLGQLHDLQVEVTRIAQEFCEYFSIDLQVKVPLRVERERAERAERVERVVSHPPTPPLGQEE